MEQVSARHQAVGRSAASPQGHGGGQSAAISGPLGEVAGTHSRLAALQKSGVRFIRLLYPDLHGVARGKIIPIDDFAEIAEQGTPFVGAIMTVDLRHNVVAGFESGFEDIVARPDLSTLVQVPWDGKTAWCLADLERLEAGVPYPVDPRGALRRIIARYEQREITPILAPELEFYLCEPDTAAPGGFRPYAGHDSPVYGFHHAGDHLGLLERLLDGCVALGLGAFAANHEYGRSQFEINLRHAPALLSADRALLFKTAVKELAAREGLRATFMGKPWNGDEGSGFHLHISLAGDAGANLFHEASAPMADWAATRSRTSADGLAPALRYFTAGVLAHAPGLMALLNPTVNAYRRINPEALVPTRANWGHDNRFTYVRIPGERGAATRVEVRVGDGAANPYLAYAAVLVAGLDGLQREIEPPQPLAGFIYELPESDLGAALPTSLEAALDALAADDVLLEGLGAELVAAFTTIKRAELGRYRAWVSDWEFTEYSHHL